MEIFNTPLEFIGLLAVVALVINIALGLKDKVSQQAELRQLNRKKAELEDKLKSLQQEVNHEDCRTI